MKLTVRRTPSPEAESFLREYEAALPEGTTLLAALKSIKEEQDPSLTFRHGCNAGICGSCAVRVDGRPALACTCRPADGATVEPLDKVPVLRDLAVDETVFKTKGKKLENALHGEGKETLPPEGLAAIAKQSECIECASCYSVCPSIVTHPDFAGPFLLTKAWRYVADPREEEGPAKIEAMQKDGVWDCILCGDCIPVCPQGIAPKNDISFLQARSMAQGFANPNPPQFGGGFSGGFGGFQDFNAPSFT